MYLREMRQWRCVSSLKEQDYRLAPFLFQSSLSTKQPFVSALPAAAEQHTLPALWYGGSNVTPKPVPKACNEPLPMLLFSAAGEDFVPPASMLMPFSIGQGRSCVRVVIIDDKVHEETEVFAVRMDTESSFMPQEVAVGRTNLSRLSIMDNDSELT